jgi:hypothetical protein
MTGGCLGIDPTGHSRSSGDQRRIERPLTA